MNLLEMIGTYGAYLQQKGRQTADLFLKQNSCDPATAARIVASFNDSGKLVKSDGKLIGFGDLSRFSKLI